MTNKDKLVNKLDNIKTLIDECMDIMENMPEWWHADGQERTGQYHDFDHQLEDAGINIDSISHAIQHDQWGRDRIVCDQCNAEYWSDTVHKC